jgi:hypothetical protein
MDIYCPGSPASLLGVSADYCQRPLIGESGMTRTQMGKRSRLVMITVYERPCAKALCISNSAMYRIINFLGTSCNDLSFVSVCCDVFIFVAVSLAILVLN